MVAVDRSSVPAVFVQDVPGVRPMAFEHSSLGDDLTQIENLFLFELPLGAEVIYTLTRYVVPTVSDVNVNGVDVF